MPPRVDEPPNDAAPCNSKEQVPWERVRVGSRRLMTDDTQHPPWPSPNRAPDRRVSGRKRGWRGIHGGIRIEHVGGLTYVLPNLPGLAIDEDKPLAWGEMRRDGRRASAVGECVHSGSPDDQLRGCPNLAGLSSFYIKCLIVLGELIVNDVHFSSCLVLFGCCLVVQWTAGQMF